MRRRHRHYVTVTETDIPGAFEVRCDCGYAVWTPWGEERARSMGKEHLIRMGEMPMEKK